METRTTLHLGLHSLYIANNSILILPFSLEHGTSLHKSQRPTDLKPKVSSFYLSSVSGKKQKSLTCVSLVLCCVVSTSICWNSPSRFTMSTSTCTNNLLSLASVRYVSTILPTDLLITNSAPGSTGLFWQVLLWRGTTQSLSLDGLSYGVSLGTSVSTGRLLMSEHHLMDLTLNKLTPRSLLCRFHYPMTDFENGYRSLTWQGIPSVHTDHGLTTSVMHKIT